MLCFPFPDRVSNLPFTCKIVYVYVGDVGLQLHSVCLRADWLWEDLLDARPRRGDRLYQDGVECGPRC